jgi:hypothetical protein
MYVRDENASGRHGDVPPTQVSEIDIGVDPSRCSQLGQENHGKNTSCHPQFLDKKRMLM